MARYNNPPLVINNIKYDLLKIIEPWDGILSVRQTGTVYHLFNAYLRDLRREGMIREYNIDSSVRDTAITYDVSIKFNTDRSPKRLKIHVGTFQYPWIPRSSSNTAKSV